MTGFKRKWIDKRYSSERPDFPGITIVPQRSGRYAVVIHNLVSSPGKWRLAKTYDNRSDVFDIIDENTGETLRCIIINNRIVLWRNL